MLAFKLISSRVEPRDPYFKQMPIITLPTKKEIKNIFKSQEV